MVLLCWGEQWEGLVVVMSLAVLSQTPYPPAGYPPCRDFDFPGLTWQRWAKPAAGNGWERALADLDLHFLGLEDLVGLCKLFQVSRRQAQSRQLPVLLMGALAQPPALIILLLSYSSCGLLVILLKS